MWLMFELNEMDESWLVDEYWSNGFPSDNCGGFDERMLGGVIYSEDPVLCIWGWKMVNDYCLSI